MIAIIAGFLPTLLISPFAGVWADRYSRKLLIIVADSLIALATLALALLFLAGYGSVWLLFAASAVRSLGAGIQMPAVMAFLPQIAPQDALTKVNATNGAIQSTVSLFAPMLAGALLMVASIEWIFFVDVFTAAVAVAILAYFLRVSVHQSAMEKQHASYFADVRAGLAYINQNVFLKAFFAFNALFFVCLGPVAFLTPLQVARTFGDQVWRLTAIEMGFSIGMTLGGILIAWWGGFRNKTHSMAFAFFIFGWCTVALGIVPVFWIYVTVMAILGIVIPIFNTPAIVLLQQKVEDAFLGRIFSVNTMISSTLMPLTMLVYGPMADVIPIEWMLWATGALVAVLSLFMVRNKALIEAGSPVSEVEAGG